MRNHWHPSAHDLYIDYQRDAAALNEGNYPIYVTLIRRSPHTSTYRHRPRYVREVDLSLRGEEGREMFLPPLESRVVAAHGRAVASEQLAMGSAWSRDAGALLDEEAKNLQQACA